MSEPGRVPTAFRHLTDSGQTTGLLVCERCGAVVHDSAAKTHAAWHATAPAGEPS